MARVDSSILEGPIRDVISAASRGKDVEPWFLTAYQILCRLPTKIRQHLVDEYGESGRDAGHHFSAATRVAQVAARIPGVEKAYIDTTGLGFNTDENTEVLAGYELCAIFRINP